MAWPIVLLPLKPSNATCPAPSPRKAQHGGEAFDVTQGRSLPTAATSVQTLNQGETRVSEQVGDSVLMAWDTLRQVTAR